MIKTTYIMTRTVTFVILLLTFGCDQKNTSTNTDIYEKPKNFISQDYHLFRDVLDSLQEKIIFLIENDNFNVTTDENVADSIVLDKKTHNTIFSFIEKHKDIIEIEICFRGTNFKVLFYKNLTLSYFENEKINANEVISENPIISQVSYSTSFIDFLEALKNNQLYGSYYNVAKYNKDFVYKNTTLVEISVFRVLNI